LTVFAVRGETGTGFCAAGCGGPPAAAAALPDGVIPVSRGIAAASAAITAAGRYRALGRVRDRPAACARRSLRSTQCSGGHDLSAMVVTFPESYSERASVAQGQGCGGGGGGY